MANINVTYDQMESASRRMESEGNDMQAKLNQLRQMVDNLVTDGYVTDKSSVRFNEVFQDLDKGGKQVMDGLTGIADYLKQAAEALRKTDEELANALNK